MGAKMNTLGKTENTKVLRPGLHWECVSLHDTHRLETIEVLLGGERRLVEFLFKREIPELRRSPRKLLTEACSLSSGETISIKAAIDFWNGRGNARLSEMLSTWDEATWNQFIRAVCHWAHNHDEILHGLIDDMAERV
jgi:hypothetical protein